MSDLNLPDCKVIFSFQSDCKDLKNRETTFIDHDINFRGSSNSSYKKFGLVIADAWVDNLLSIQRPLWRKK